MPDRSLVLPYFLCAGWRQRKQARERGQDGSDQEEVMLAGRNIGLFVGILTMGATWVGGNFNGYDLLKDAKNDANFTAFQVDS